MAVLSCKPRRDRKWGEIPMRWFRSVNQSRPLLVLPSRHMGAGWLRTAVTTLVNPAAPDVRAGRIKKRFLAFRVAIWAKPMRWFGAAFIWLQHVSHGSFPGTLKFIILLLSIPIFEAGNFCFQRAYSIQLHRVRLSGLDSLVEALQNEAAKFDGFGPKRLSVAQTYHCLRDIKRSADSCNCRGDFSGGHEQPLPFPTPLTSGRLA
jgi:hypothetical protein